MRIADFGLGDRSAVVIDEDKPEAKLPGTAKGEGQEKAIDAVGDAAFADQLDKLPGKRPPIFWRQNLKSA
ncbi:hypothetical protein VB780_29630 [Leptolyngbya sp. CCNP1308]|uniref:hypothetical protein n=1 Tax=Leptolyngbya sp. CCNP1308 TaxID=3110255 RepID=UPI002B1F9ED9|nr:hypothetical protein [Leptolyngbya sp. CCNP1308]MEA5452769.1 hypothetical protein [Leptolyngbya sp. CCNP1308]